MAQVRPFRGLLYNSDRIGSDYSLVVAPPYDVISSQMQDELYEKNSYNVVRLILGKSFDNDSETNNKYIRARDFLNEWIKKDVFKKDDISSFYIYLEEYDYAGRRRRRMGFIGLMKICEEKEEIILPHENTYTRPKQDRLSLIKEVRSNLSPIFSLYDDDKGVIAKLLEEAVSSSNPIIDVVFNSERHKLWRLSDRESIEKIISFLDDKKVFIADGHHRYEVAKNYRDMRRKEPGYKGSADYIMMYFTNLREREALTIMATHRVIKKMPIIETAEILKRLERYFDLKECKDLIELMRRLEEKSNEDYVFGFLNKDKYVFLVPKDKKKLLQLIQEKKSEEWKKLDVSMLHSAVLSNVLQVEAKEGNITYVRDPKEAEALIKDGTHAASFLLNPTKIEQLKAVAERGEMMPQKSTYFYPKLLSGLVIYRFEE